MMTSLSNVTVSDKCDVAPSEAVRYAVTVPRLPDTCGLRAILLAAADTAIDLGNRADGKLSSKSIGYATRDNIDLYLPIAAAAATKSRWINDEECTTARVEVVLSRGGVAVRVFASAE